MASALWKFDRVTLGAGRSPRLRDVTLEIREGATAVLGCSGSGKTSLLNLLVGFERPDSGSIWTALSGQNRRLPLYWVPQNQGLWPHLTVRQHLEAAAPPGAGESEIAALLSAVEMTEKSSARPDELSQGERSRVAVGRALATRASVLVMDEPLANIDAAQAARCWKAIRGKLSETGASLVFATHSPKAVLGEAGAVICLKDGRVLYEGSVDELYRRPATPELAGCLGEGNWLAPEEARLWLNAQADAARCYRPEQICVSRADNGPIVVQSARFHGAVAEAELRHEETGATRVFHHRPASDGLQPGDRVILKLVLLLFFFLPGGCGGPAAPTIAVQKFDVWQMPSDGPRIPAPRALAVDGEGRIVALDTAGRMLIFDSQGGLRSSWRMPESKVGNPEGVCVLKDGRIAVADTHYHRVVFFNPEGEVCGTWGRYGRGRGEFVYPVSIAQDAAENIYVCEYGSNDRVQKFTREGRFLLSFGSFGTRPGEFQRPSGIVWRDGKVYVADAINNRVQVFEDDGRFIRLLAADAALHFPYDIACGPDGFLYAVEYGAGRVSRLDPGGGLIGRYGSTGAGEGEFRTPWGIAVDPKGRIYVADTGNRRIVQLCR